MTAAPFLSRYFGDYLLVAQLSEDALGTVFRALYAADERRFVRLRILQSPELSREALVRVFDANASRVEALAHDTIVPQPQLAVAEDLPFLTWDETAGWTLDTMLARVRQFGIRIPAEYALLIAERIAAALEHAHGCVADGRPTHHGMLWPGFVSISHDAAVRVGGFGVAEGILPTLAAPRLTSDIAPYIAPESRAFADVGTNSDVYSLGAILIELLTGRRPSLEAPSAELRAGDPRSDELAAFLKRCLAQPDVRFASSADAHRALQQMVTGNPFSLYTANLALFLYKLLNPESQSVASTSDFESTNPVLEKKAVAPDPLPSSEESPALPETLRRRKGDLETSEEPVAAAEVRMAAPAPAPSISIAPAAEPVDSVPAPQALQNRAVELLSGAPFPPPAPIARAWARAAAPLAAAAGVALAAFLVASQIQSVRSESAVSRVVAEPPVAPAAQPLPAASAQTFESPALPTQQAAAAAPTGSLAPASRRAQAKPARKIPTEQRHPAEDLRLRAALARIEADRVNAREAAQDLFGEGRQSEEEGERLLREHDYDAAQLAFSRAARLFERAQERSWEERVRQASLSQDSR